jgi:hypothetical protein
MLNAQCWFENVEDRDSLEDLCVGNILKLNLLFEQYLMQYVGFAGSRGNSVVDSYEDGGESLVPKVLYLLTS